MSLSDHEINGDIPELFNGNHAGDATGNGLANGHLPPGREPNSATNGARSPGQGIAYFSMEIGLESSIPTYSGGLGVLAGDTLRAASDLGLPMVGVTLLHRRGTFRQKLDELGNQIEQPQAWQPEAFLKPLPVKASVRVEGRIVAITAWQYTVTGVSGHTIPVYFLDTMLPENDPRDRDISGTLYGGDQRYRLAQEIVLGMGGSEILRSLHPGISRVHMNEGHCAFAALALLLRKVRERGGSATLAQAISEVRRDCVFTTHTPVPAGHDEFNADLVRQVLGETLTETLTLAGCMESARLNMTMLALRLSGYANAVSQRHGEVSRTMFPGFQISSVTNGIHSRTWVSQGMAHLFDTYTPGWRQDTDKLADASRIPISELISAHATAKKELLDEVERRTGTRLSLEVMTIGFARRATAYKRAHLLLSDPESLRRIVDKHGPLQVVYAGKAHPRDEGGKFLIRHIVESARKMANMINVVYVSDYDMKFGALVTAGVDLWLNNPRRPHEASGTSGMKAALNGVPSLSVLDGWWIEGHTEGVTGWSIGGEANGDSGDQADALSLYSSLEREIVPLYYRHRTAYGEVMRTAIAYNGPQFSAQRMMKQYAAEAYKYRELVGVS